MVGHPTAQGIPETFRAIAAVPLLGLVAVAVDAAEVLVRRSSDNDWGETKPNTNAAASANEEL